MTARKTKPPTARAGPRADRETASRPRATAQTTAKPGRRPGRPKKKTVRVFSWNVNGIRSAVGKGFLDWLGQSGGDIVGLQEVRASVDAIPRELVGLPDYHQHWVAATRKGYSGVGLLSRPKPDAVETSLGESRFDDEGRLQLARFGRLVIANGYFPNGSGQERDNGRVPYKLDWYRALFERIEALRRDGLHVLVLGDFNTAHREIDLARPGPNAGTSGFTPIEREALDSWITGGWVDSFRRFEGGPGHYTWWSQRFGVREKNIGWRIDLALATPGCAQHLVHAWHEPHVMGSDHCPIGVAFAPEVVGRRRGTTAG